jgi:THAP4-like, heme-binding beta-barrel domain
MTKPALGVLVGAALGLLDGLSAWAYPEARAMIVSIVISSTVKGVVTGAATGWVARRWRSMAGGIAAGIGIGFVLSTAAAVPVMSQQPSRYFDIVLPGMLLGAIVGFVTQRYRAGRGQASGRHAVPLAVLLFLLPATIAGQQPVQPDPFGPIAALLGRWEGTSEGQPGKAQVQREYRRVLNSRFIHARNRSEYAPQDKNPKGEIHEDEGWFSFDRARKRLVLRQFHVEGFVNQYVQDADASDSNLVFTTEAIENIPAGWRARETYIVHGPDEFEEIFELAEAGKPFEVYSRARLKRVK